MKDDSSKRLINNSFYLMTDWITVTILSLIFWLVVGKTLDTSGYGIVATTTNIALLIAAFGMVGVFNAATNMISRFLKKNNIRGARGVIKFSIKFVFIVNFVSAVVLFVFSSNFASLLNLPIESIWLGSLLIFGWGFWILTTGLLQGLQNMRKIFQSNLIGHILKVTLPLVFFFIGLNFISPILAFIISLLITVFIRLPAIWPYGKSSTKIDGRNMIFTLALPVFIASVMWLVFTNLPNVILNSITSNDVTGIFALAMTLVTPIVFIPMTLNQALFPITSGLSETKNPQRRQGNLIAMVIKVASFITIPLIALLFVFSNQIILFFSQPQYLPAADLLVIVAPAALFLGIGQIMVSSIFAIGKPNVTRNITILVTIVFLATSIPATFMFSSFGMGFSLLISMMILISASFLYLRKTIKLKINKLALAKIIIAALVFTAFAYPLNLFFGSVLIKILLIVASAVLYLGILIPLRYYSMDEVKIIRHLSSKSNFVKKTIKPIEKLLLRSV